MVQLLKLEFSPKALKSYTGILFDSALSCLFACCVDLLLMHCCFSCVGMVLNTEKRRMLAEAPLAPTPTPSLSAPAPTNLKQKGVAKVAAFEDEDTYIGLVYKRKRGVDVAVSAHSVSDGCAPSFRENPLSASSPRDLVVHEDGEENVPGGNFGVPLAAELPAFFQEVLQTFQGGEVDGQGENPLGGPVARGLGVFLIASSRASTQVQELRVEVLRLREESTLQTKRFTQCETALHQELANLRQTKKETKRLLFEKSQEALSAHSKILPLRNEVIELKEMTEKTQGKMARLE